MLPWRRSHLSYLITPRVSPACTGSVAVAALPVHDMVAALPVHDMVRGVC